ncbi:MAG: amidohydrolase [Bacteroidetes bacterium]|nr:amidohydrolase [Bacteroidota bacterium]
MKNILGACLLLIFAACGARKEVDSIFLNGKIYTVDSAFNVVQAMAVQDGKIIATGTNEQINQQYQSKNKVDLNGQFVYPGFYDAHCHFYGYGIDQKKINLTATTSFENLVDTLIKYRDKKFSGWIYGRGWDQNDWSEKKFPTREKLDSLFPDVPVLLIRVDGHAALCNQKALTLANITASTKIPGGEIITTNGQPTGLLIDNAVDIVKAKVPKPSRADQIAALITAQENCFAVGLTSIADAGLDRSEIELIDSLQKEGKIKMRCYTMISYTPDNAAYYFKKGKIKTDYLNVRSFKVYADGALGSRGACLSHDYADLPGHRGFLLTSVSDMQDAANQIYKNGFQMNTHCIGDSANHLLLQLYKKAFGNDKQTRWRIEHAQVLQPGDISEFGKLGIIPSVQPTHATSDMYWADERLGNERLKTAYAYHELLLSYGLVACGSDFPVESINPLFGFYAAVVRKDQQGFPQQGFQTENKLSREQALRGMTIWAAYAAFEENEKGSIEKGKFADFVITRQDLLTAPDSILYQVAIDRVYSNGIKVY